MIPSAGELVERVWVPPQTALVGLVVRLNNANTILGL